MGGMIPVSDLEKTLEQKKAERDKYKNMQNTLRHGITDADYTPQELEELEYVRKTDRAAGGFLPSKILDKTRPLMEKVFKLNTEIEQLETMIESYNKK